MKRRSLTLSLLAALAVTAGGSGATVATAAPAKKTAGPDLSGVTLTVGQIGKSFQAILDYAGQSRTPYKVKWASLDAAPPVLQALQGGAVDLGFASDNAVAGAISNGASLKAVGLVRAPANGFAVLTPKGSSITSIAGLKGKRVGVFKGSAGEAFLLKALKSAKLSIGDVTVVNLTPPQGAAAFGSGNIDAWAIWDPVASATVLSSGARELVTGKGGLFDYFSFLTTTPKVAGDAKKSAAIADFAKRFARASAYVGLHPRGWVAAYAKAYGIPTAVAQRAASRSTGLRLLPLDTSAAKEFLRSLGNYRELGQLKAAVNPNRFFLPRFNKQIAAGAKSAK